MIIQAIPAFHDNYLWLFHQQGSRDAFVVAPGDAAPVLEKLREQALTLAGILITHHHLDHIGGIDTLLGAGREDIPVYGPCSPHIPQVTHPLAEADRIAVGGCTFSILEVPGHTLDHIAYFAAPPASNPLLFCGDTLFAGGCGRLFEGTPEQMHQSLQKLAALPANTAVYCAHEYTQANLHFALAVEPDNPALQSRQAEVMEKRHRHLATVPSFLAQELASTPFLRCHTLGCRASRG